MKINRKLMFVLGVSLLALPLYAQDGGFGGGFGGGSIDVTNILNGGGFGGRGGPGGFGRGGPQIPDAYSMYGDIKSTLKKGKTPLAKEQEKPLQDLLSMEVVALADRIQLLRSNNGFSGGGPDQGGFPRGNSNPASGNSQVNELANAVAIQTDTITRLKNDEFLNTKLSLFLSPEQIALVEKAHADDKTNATCLEGLLDRYSSQIQNSSRGNNRSGNRGNFDSILSGSNSDVRPNGEKYCMTANSTPADRLEPIRKVLAQGNLPLSMDKESLAEIVMKSQLQDLDAALRTGLTGGGFQGNRGGFMNTRNNNPELIIQSSTDEIYMKAAASLTPPQAETLKKSQYKEFLDRGGIETLIAVEAMQETPLTDDQVVMATAAWPELENQVQAEESARQGKKKVSQKDVDRVTISKVLEMLEPEQVASFEAAKKYGTEALKGN